MTMMERTICEIYGHCYCKSTQVTGKVHQQCCKCSNTNMVLNQFRHSLERERRTIQDLNPGYFTKMVD